jgi:hypothetical protein
MRDGHPSHVMGILRELLRKSLGKWIDESPSIWVQILLLSMADMATLRYLAEEKAAQINQNSCMYSTRLSCTKVSI